MHRPHLPIIGGLIAIGAALLVIFVYPPTQANPDPNHTHADFAVWIGGEQMDFSDAKYMSGSSDEEEDGDHPHEHLHDFLHLHDGNGTVVHRHKPGLSFVEFLDSLGIGIARTGGKYCLFTRSPARCDSEALRLFVNGEEVPAISGYMFADLDQILLTDSTDPAEVQKQWNQLTDDACRYSQTCPWRGAPPAENCISDPTVPCMEP